MGIDKAGIDKVGIDSERTLRSVTAQGRSVSALHE